MKIKILGTGGAYSKLSTAYLLEKKILIDCGQSIISSLIDNSFNSSILNEIEHLFITHIHSDHINGLESFLYYKLIKNKFQFDDNLTIYGTKEVLDYYKSIAFSTDALTGKYYQPFKFVLINPNSNNTIVLEDLNLHVNSISAKHMNGNLSCLSYIFVNLNNHKNKIIITGDIDEVNKLISPNMINSTTLLFHDMGWTNLPIVDNKYKFHPREEEVFEYYGKNKNIIGIHTDLEKLKYYEKAILNKEYII